MYASLCVRARVYACVCVCAGACIRVHRAELSACLRVCAHELASALATCLAGIQGLVPWSLLTSSHRTLSRDPRASSGWSSGRVEVRSEANGEVVYRDKLESQVAALCVSEYRGDGKQQVICTSVEGEVKG